MSGRVIRALAQLAAVAALAGCGVDGLAFRQDHRVEIVQPSDRSEVTVPFEVRWTTDGLDTTDASFGVVVDREPPPPGRSLDWLLRDDPGCRAGACPAERLAEANLFQTSETSIEITRLKALPRSAAGLHEVVVILLDEAGRRVGETGFRLQVRTVEEAR